MYVFIRVILFPVPLALPPSNRKGEIISRPPITSEELSNDNLMSVSICISQTLLHLDGLVSTLAEIGRHGVRGVSKEYHLALPAAHPSLG